MKRIARHQHRIWALQILYSLDLMEKMNETKMDEQVEKLKEREGLLSDNYYFEELVKGVIENKKNYDSIINKKAINWKLERISCVGRNILRMALYEVDCEMPMGVAANEAVELAKKFGDKKSFSFINGILGKIKE